MLSAAAYCRVSGQSQVSGDGFPRQLAAIRAYCDSHDLKCSGEYLEEAVPGKMGEEDRPAFQRMVADLLGNGCRTIVIEGLDRLARQYDIQQQLATYLASKGLTLISVNTGEDITAALMGDPMRRALVQIQGIFAELDKNLLIAKLRKARDRKKVTTGKGEGRHSYGEKIGEKEVVDEIYALSHGGGHSSRKIAEILNLRNRPTRSGKPWLGSVVAKIVKRLKTA